MLSATSWSTVARLCSRVVAGDAVAWLGEVLRGLRQVEGQYAGVGGRSGEIGRYLRAKVHTLNDLHLRLTCDAREGAREMLGTLAEFEPSRWIEEDYGTETFRLVCGKVDRIRGALIARLTSGAPLPEVSTVA